MNSTDVTTAEEPFALKLVLRLFYVMVFLVGLCGNLLVCIVVVQQRRMRTVINYFTLNLAVSDLVFIIIYLPSQLAAYENKNWPLGNIGCRIVYSIVPVCLTTSIATLLAISCERFRGIAFPFQPRLRLTTVRRIILLIWLVSLITAVPLMFVAGTIHTHGNVYCDEKWPSPISSRFYWIAMFLLQYVIPLLVMTVLYGIAGWKLRRRSIFVPRSSDVPRSSRHSSINSAAEIARQRQSQKITNMLVALIVIYSFCMLPQHVIYFWRIYGNFEQWKHWLYALRISNLFPMANSALNSIVYGTLQADFRKAYKRFFKRCNLCFCTKKYRNKSNEGKPLRTYNKVAIKIKQSQKEPLENPVTLKIRSDINVANNDKSAPNTTKTIIKCRTSSDSQSCLISGESTNTSESQASKQGDFGAHKETVDQGKDLTKTNGLQSWDKVKENNTNRSHPCSVQTATTYVQVLINKEPKIEQSSIRDIDKELSFIFDADIEIGDIFVLESAKETVL